MQGLLTLSCSLLAASEMSETLSTGTSASRTHAPESFTLHQCALQRRLKPLIAEVKCATKDLIQCDSVQVLPDLNVRGVGGCNLQTVSTFRRPALQRCSPESQVRAVTQCVAASSIKSGEDCCTPGHLKRLPRQHHVRLHGAQDSNCRLVVQPTEGGQQWLSMLGEHAGSRAAIAMRNLAVLSGAAAGSAEMMQLLRST